MTPGVEPKDCIHLNLHSEFTFLDYIQSKLFLDTYLAYATKASSGLLAVQLCLSVLLPAGCTLFFRGHLGEKMTRVQNLVRRVEELDHLLPTRALQGQRGGRFRPPVRLRTDSRPAKVQIKIEIIQEEKAEKWRRANSEPAQWPRV